MPNRHPLAPGGHLAAKAEAGRNRITLAEFRKAGGKLRPNVLNRFVATVKDIQLFLRTYSNSGN